MINLTEEQIRILKNMGYNTHTKGNESIGPWYKDFKTNDENIDFEIIINPYMIKDNVVVGCTGESNGDNDYEIDSFTNAKEIFEELIILKGFGIW